MMDEAEPRFTAYWVALGNRREPVTGHSVESCLARLGAKPCAGALSYTVTVVERVPQVTERAVYRGSVTRP